MKRYYYKVLRMLLSAVIMIGLLSIGNVRLIKAEPSEDDSDTQQEQQNESENLRSGTERGFKVVGGTEGEDYTYENGVLTILKGSDYTISMAENVTVTSDQICIKQSADLPSLNITFQDLNVVTTEAYNMYLSCSSAFPLNINLSGVNNFSSATRFFEASTQYGQITIKGSAGKLNIDVTGTPNLNGSLNGSSLTFESGDVVMNNTSIEAINTIEVKGGTLTIKDAPTNVNSAIYVNGNYKQTGGKVTVTSKKIGLFCTGVAQTSNPGIEILGGDLSIDSVSYGVYTGYKAQKDMIIDTTGTVSIDTNSDVGIALGNKSDLFMKNGILNINGPKIGIYALSADGNVNVSGGETEITSILRAIDLRVATEKDLIYGSGYEHKNYQGADADSRAEVSDADIINAAGISNKYVLITPVYSIEYVLNGGSIPEGQENPVLYTRVDTFTLVNPVNPDDSLEFIGWIGTDLEEETLEVTVPVGSKGDREYEAVWSEGEIYYTCDTTNTHTQGVDKDEAFTYKRNKRDEDTYSIFTDGGYIEINGTELDPANYETAPGSLLLTLKGSYVKTLAAGQYSVKAVFPDGEAEGTLIIKSSGKDDDKGYQIPKTGIE